uniref:Alkyl sulfatase C-terminal domain-containing protein n=1 Tax=Aliivibrio wodanis TaxID=80852 RepID=A0A5Q4ZXY0_9GAMM|nr:hypothetical protein AW0309160_04195 [Aliivibrio wodanis]
MGIQTDKPMKADTTLTINKSDMSQLLVTELTLPDLLESQKAALKGDSESFMKMASTVVTFTPDFDIVPMPNKSAK